MKKKQVWIGLLLASAMVLGACNGDKEVTKSEEGSKVNNELLVLSGDTVSEKGGCVLSSRYAAGDKIVFRINAIDPETNEQAKNAKLQVHLSTGENLDMTYGKHGDDNFWVVAYPVTQDTPTGALEYTVTAEDGNKKGEFKPFNVQPSLITVVSAEVKKENKKEEKKEVSAKKVEVNQNVDITAKNFEFFGPKGEKEFHVKAGKEVTMTLKSDEGAHGLAIEGLDVNLKEANGTVKFTPEKAGEYQIVCSVFCGAGHGDMSVKLVVVD